MRDFQRTIEGEEFVKRFALTFDPGDGATAISSQGTPEEYGPLLEKPVELKASFLQPTEYEIQSREQLPIAQEIITKVEGKPNPYSLDALFDLWVQVSGAKQTRKHRFVIELLKSVIGDVNYADITSSHIAAFRNHIEKSGISRVSQVTYISLLKSMFSAAESEGKIELSPARAVRSVARRATARTDTTGRSLGPRCERLRFGSVMATRSGMWR
jgi:hypothetical protein